MVGAVIYIRVSTKEQTENLSLPTQLRACEQYCQREGYQVLERFKEEGESAKTTDRTELQKLLKYCRRTTRAPQVAWHFVALRHGADRRHIHRQADGGRPGVVRAIRQ